MVKFVMMAPFILAAFYLVLVGVLALNQRAMIYHPDPIRIDPADAGVGDMVPVPLRAEDGSPVGGWYAPPRAPGLATVVFFHGNSGTVGSRAFKARALMDAGFGVFMVEYRGYGGMAGSPSEPGLYADGRAAVRWLLGRGVGHRHLVLYGESLGAAVAVQLAGEFDPGRVVLECPFTSVPDLAPAYVLPFLARLAIVDRFDNLAKMAGLAAPVMIIHGERDGTVPIEQARALLAAAPAEKEGVFLAPAGHNDLWDHGAGEKVVEFIGRGRPPG